MEVMTLQKEYISVKELAQKLGVHINMVYKNIAKQIPFYKFGTKVCFRIDEVEAWIKAQRHEGIK